jgi:long-chain acyl-CoA synthetase
MEALIYDAITAAARSTPGKLALVTPDAEIGYADLIARADRVAARLAAAGVAAGDRVALAAENSIGYIVWALGTWRAGAVLATVYPSFGPTELGYVLRNAQPGVIVTDEGRRAAMRRAVQDSGRKVPLWTINGDGDVEHGDTDAGSDVPAVTVSVDPSQVGLICYTSGSTANPKPVAHSHRGVAAGAQVYASTWRLGKADRTMVTIPMAWVYGLATTTLATLSAGGTVVALPRFNPVNVIEALTGRGVTFLPGVTTMYVKLTTYVREARLSPDLSRLRLCVSGGEPRNEQAFAIWREISGCPVHDGYCASECFPVITYDPIEDPEPRLGSAGRVVPAARMRIVGPDGAEVAAGETGEAQWQGPALMLSYWNEPEMTAQAMTADGWYRSLDYVRLDEDGYVYVMGRASDMIIRGGSNISPAEVEAVLLGHPDVVEAAVLGLPDPEYGSKVAAAVVLRPGSAFDEAAIREYCGSHLAPYKVPTLVKQTDDLPRNATGKVQRRAIAQRSFGLRANP